MAIFMESFLELHPGSKYLFVEDDDEKAPHRLKEKYGRVLRNDVWHKPEFTELAPEGSPTDTNGFLRDIGTISVRKCPMQLAINCGASVMEVNVRARWKDQGGGPAFFRCVNLQQTFADANVAAVLCRGGAVRYQLKHDVELTDTWLFEHVVPHLRRRYPVDNGLCRVLGHALLYICLSSNEEVAIPTALCNRVKAAYAALGLDEEQPVERVALHIYRLPNGTFGIGDRENGGKG